MRALSHSCCTEAVLLLIIITGRAPPFHSSFTHGLHVAHSLCDVLLFFYGFSFLRHVYICGQALSVFIYARLSLCGWCVCVRLWCMTFGTEAGCQTANISRDSLRRTTSLWLHLPVWTSINQAGMCCSVGRQQCLSLNIRSPQRAPCFRPDCRV